MTPRQVLDEHAALGRLVHEAGRSRPAPRLTNSKDLGRPLRVGFVSGEFCWHACAMFMEGLIRELDRSQIHPFLYYVRAQIEEPTRRFQAMAGPDRWRHMPDTTTEQLAAQILADKIDILIDTMGWTELQRMSVFEPRVAPIQMTWLGYPNTTGLPSMDYRIVDAITDPPGAEAFCTEKLLRLPGCFLSYLPDSSAPEPATTPALAQSAITNPQSAITFGSFNRLSKVRPGVARTWAAILRAVPDSRLILKTSLVSENVKAEYMREFAAEGVTPNRLIWSSFVTGVQAHLAMYHQVDIALDSFPYNGTTTCEATWMGVPVITLTGDVHRARVGTSLLTALNLPELIAPTRERYIELAVDLANDRSRLAEYHTSLRVRMSASPSATPRLIPAPSNPPSAPPGAPGAKPRRPPHEPQPAPAPAGPGPARREQGRGRPRHRASASPSSPPPDPDVNTMMGMILLRLGRLDQAIYYARRSAAGDPNDPIKRTNLAIALIAASKNEEGPAILRRVVETNPEYHDARLALMNLMLGDRRAAEAIDLCRAGLAIGWHAQLSVSYAAALISLSENEAAVKFLHEAIAKFPNETYLAASLCLALNAMYGATPDEIAAAHRAYGALLNRVKPPFRPTYTPKKEPDKKLRIALVSPDFRQHSVAFYIEPFLEHFDRERFEVICYSTNRTFDAVSRTPQGPRLPSGATRGR